ncbi:chromosomal serine/threonine-protein kinase JIL-1 [Anastrepha ludens]|uniref:chromosomal serine/threonine-protein kinase JIL-1 n=1 Tax=Anastrepha ludens TaxID=28586 RepID=UPI0023B08DDA|nr:chromosomal serine/threonine-protein kinase JIL-1 [Anastrepha ludens]XP_053956877.1 chromosomal serine/threonine-protein kinase JIL-1 [Anastrepha ludens]XP_053956878.1 chromosomal serine/threonine-protein kinase JIL-1 [Anastrepha ludens]XP_053956879.1 chromosomal serine/threonine-protein kinase JIL-1 [Anastrepha ludens]XP_053956880.1 chromosomal serine/threonine-protein kinase JIL-1 [Anastrepha ludens]XP_053956881.1 chromosomal serine/threonine-protein kinase JIL-1 [Anastrepha ludens]XP_05
MSRYYNNSSGGSSTKALNLTASATSKKMATRRQAEHESGFYEQPTNETHFTGGNSSTSSVGSAKRTRQPSGEQYMNGGRSKRQKVNIGAPNISALPASAHIAAHGQSKSHRQGPITVTTNNKQEQRNQYYANNNNNNKRYVLPQIPPQQAQHQQVSHTSANKKTTANNNNNNNINSNKNSYYVQLTAKMNVLPVAETIEVPDSSDSDDDTKVNRRAVISGSSKERQANGGDGGMPTLIVSGSSSSNSNCQSNAPHHQQQQQQQVQNKFKYEQQQQELSVNGASSSGQAASKNREISRKGDASNSSNNVELERMQREIEEVTQVHTKCTAMEEEKVNLSHFKLIRVLGTGAYGKVFLVRKIGGDDDMTLYAMKVLKKDTVVQKKKTAEHTTTERQVLEAIQQSPFLVGMHYAFQTDSKLYLILDYVSGGELFTHLYTAEYFSVATVRIYIAEVVLALEHLHKLGIIYRDIKLENILLDGQGHIVLADFGLSKIFEPDSDHRAHSFCGTLEYMAPEIIRAGPTGHDLAADWWSVGVLTYELLTGASPFTVVEQQNSQVDISRRIQKVDPVLPSTLNDTVKDFILKMLHKDPKKRLGGNSKNAAEIKKHPFFKGIDWDELKSKRRKAPFKPKLDSEDDTQNFSEEFTKQPVIDSPAPVPVNTHRLFRGYSYVAPQHLKSLRATQNVYDVEYCKNPVMTPSPCPPTLQLKSLLSNGSFGSCYILNDSERHLNHVAKVISEKLYRPAEVDALRSCSHRNICKYVNTYRNGSNIWIVMEYVAGGELQQFIHASGGLSESQSCDIFLQICDAVQYLHSKNFIHGDLKPENILFADTQMKRIKLVDFGSASYNSSAATWQDVPRYTLDYAPPESLANAQCSTYSKAYDIWCLGATLYAMYMGHPPFRRNQIEQIHDRIVKQRILDGDIQNKSSRWKNAKPAMKQLIVDFCLQSEPAKRTSIEGLLGHQFLCAKFDELQKVLRRLNRQQSDDTENSDVEEVIATETDALSEKVEVKNEDALIEENISCTSEEQHENADVAYGEVEGLAAVAELNETFIAEEIEEISQEQQPAVMAAVDESVNYTEWQATASALCATQESDTQSTHEGLESEGDTTSGLGRSKSSDHMLIERQTLSVNSLKGLEASGEQIEAGELTKLDYVISEKTVSADELNDSMLEEEVDEQGFTGFDEEEIVERKVNYIDILLTQIEQNKAATIEVDNNEIDNVAALTKTEPVVEETNEAISAINENDGTKVKTTFNDTNAQANKVNTSVRSMEPNEQSEDLRSNKKRQRNVTQVRANRPLSVRKCKTGARRKGGVPLPKMEESKENIHEEVEKIAIGKDMKPKKEVGGAVVDVLEENYENKNKTELSLAAQSKTIQSRRMRRSIRVPTHDDENNWLGLPTQLRAKYAQRFKARFRVFTLLLFSTQNALRYFKIERRYYEYDNAQEQDTAMAINKEVVTELQQHKIEGCDKQENNIKNTKKPLHKQIADEVFSTTSKGTFKAMTTNAAHEKRQTHANSRGASRSQQATHASSSSSNDVVPPATLHLLPAGTLRSLRQRHVYK